MRRAAIGWIGLSAIMTCWACSSSSDGSNGPSVTGNGDDDGGVTDAGSQPGDSGSPKVDGGSKRVDGGSALAWNGGTVSATLHAACALGTGGAYCWDETLVDAGAGAAQLIPSTSGATHFVTKGGFTSDSNPLGMILCTVGASGNADCSAPSPSLAGIDVAKIATNQDGHNCLLDTTGAVKCWGVNTDGQLGSGDQNATTALVSVALPKNAIDISTPEAGTCALLEGGDVYCWGALGGSNTPTKLALGPSFAKALSANNASAATECVIESDGTIYCINSATVDTTHLNGASAITMNFSGALCAVMMSDGSVKCLDDFGNASDPVLPEKVTEISGGYTSFVARGASGAVYRWVTPAPASKVVVP